jgi:rubrerythrin
MKKSISILFFAVTLSGFILQSCAHKNSEKSEMQKPISEAKTVTAEESVSLTILNLQAAFKGETTASAKYEAYSKKAEQEGYHEIAMLYHAASVAENIHANNHKAVLEEMAETVPTIIPEFVVKSTKENLQDAISGESYESNKMYPGFMITAKSANNKFASISFDYAYRTELKHLKMYQEALVALQNNTVKSLPTVYYVCPTCGNTYQTTKPNRCGISMTSSEKFLPITSLDS